LKVVRKAGEGDKALKAALKQLDAKVAKTGWFESSKYEDGTPVAYVAAIQELGSPSKNIPARPYLRQTIAKFKTLWIKIAALESKKILRGESTVDNALTILGSTAASNIQETISTGSFKPLKKSTIANRLRKRANKKTVGSLDKPLVDTGYMLATVTYTVENK